MTNKNKIINQAQKFIQKGQWDKAIKELQKLIAEDPNDVRTLLKLGDVFAKKGQRGDATKLYKQVAESYSEQGFFLKAVAVYKQILKHDSTNLEVTLKLAELYEHLGLASEAMAQYQIASQIHDESGNAKEALDVLKRMVELDSENVASRIKLAESYSRDGAIEESIHEFTRAAEVLKRQNRIDDYVKVAERLVYHDPSRLDVIKELARLYLKRGDTKRGLAKLQLAFKAQPKDVETLTLLASAFRDLGQIQKTVFVYRELARIHQDSGRDLDARAILQKVLELDPGDAEARALLGITGVTGPMPALQPPAPAGATMPPVMHPGLAPPAQTGMIPLRDDVGGFAPRITPASGIPAPAPRSTPAFGMPSQPQAPLAPSAAPRPLAPRPSSTVLLEQAEQAILAASRATAPRQGQGQADEVLYYDGRNMDLGAEDEPAPYVTPSPPPQLSRPPAPAPSPAPPPSATLEPPLGKKSKAEVVAINKILTETDVYVKYGLRDKALEHLRKVFDIDPDSVIAFTKMRDIYLGAGDNARAAESLANLVQLHSRRGDITALKAARAELERLAPGHPLISMSASGTLPASWPTIGLPGPGEDIDSIDISENSDIHMLRDFHDPGPAEQDSLDAWLQSDPSEAASYVEKERASESPSFSEPPSLDAAFDATFSERPEAGIPFGPASDGTPSTIVVAEGDILDASSLGPADAFGAAEGELLPGGFDDSGFERERTDQEGLGLEDRSPWDERENEPGEESLEVAGGLSRSNGDPRTNALGLEDRASISDAGGEDLPMASTSSVFSLDELDQLDQLDRIEAERTPLAIPIPPARKSGEAEIHFSGDLSADLVLSTSSEDRSVADEIEEAQFLAGQGLVDEARDVLSGILARQPSHAVAQRMLRELSGGKEEPAPSDPPEDRFDRGVQRKDAGRAQPDAPSGSKAPKKSKISYL